MSAPNNYDQNLLGAAPAATKEQLQVRASILPTGQNLDLTLLSGLSRKDTMWIC
jgi:hypothetical protein